MGNYIDLAGKKFGKLTVVELYDRGAHHKPARWKCVCECGNEKIVSSQLLRNGAIKDCGCTYKNRLVGMRFGRLTVIEPSSKKQKGHGGKFWKCKCDCGNTIYVQTSNLTSESGGTKSCGCYRREKPKTHGKSYTKIYRTWQSMKSRCKNTGNSSYPNYGKRGISVCDEWSGKDGFENFYNWAMNNGYDESLTIDRINVNGNYEPSNCRWISFVEQMNNTRRNRYVEINGEVHSLTDWARIYKISLATVKTRINDGWGDVEAVTTPVMKHGYTRKNPAYTHAESD